MEEKQSKYCYHNSEVLINKLNIMDDVLLNDVDRIITTYRISQLECNDISFGNCLSIDNYLKIHKWIFRDIYSFAGEIRDEIIYKSNLPFHRSITTFCLPENIFSQMRELFTKFRSKIKRVHSRDDFISVLCWFYGEMNMIHPFREGNGRTLRTFVELFVKEANSYLNIPDMEIHYSLWDDEDRAKLLRSTIVCCLNCDTSGIESCFDKVLVEKNEKRKSR